MLLSRLRPFAALMGLLLGLATLFAASTAQAQYGCPPGYRQNRWGRCVPMRAYNQGCPPGYSLNEYNQCVPAAPPPPSCPPGTTPDQYGRCIQVQARPVACPMGTQPNGYGQCVPVQAPRPACGSCVQGAQEICNGCDDNCNGVIDENCVSMGVRPPPPPPQACPPGMAMDAYGRCVSVQPQPQVCPPGYYFFRGACIPR